MSIPEKSERLLRLPQVLDRIPYKRSRFLDLVRLGVFPRPVKLGPRAVAWPESQIDAVVQRIASGQGPTMQPGGTATIDRSM